MRLPPVKSLTKDQIRKYHAALELAYPELLESAVARQLEPKKLSKRERELEAARQDARTAGYREGVERMKREVEQAKQGFENRRKELHLETLKAVRDLASVYGQMMGEVARAMQSEKDQL